MQRDKTNEGVDLDVSEDDTVSVDITKVTKKRKKNYQKTKIKEKRRFPLLPG